MDAFEEMQAQSADQPLMMGIALRPCLVGQPRRFRPLSRALARIVGQRDRVWLTRPDEIATFCRSLPAGRLAARGPAT